MANTPNLNLENVNVLLDTDYAYNLLVSEIIAKINSNNLKIDEIPNEMISIAQKGVANGVATLGNDGLIPSEQLPSDIGGIEKVATIIDRDALVNLYDNKLVFVIDATGDTTVTSGWALYMYSVSGLSWIKIVDGESLDINLTWDDISNKPTTFPPDTHTHEQIDLNTQSISNLETNKVDKIEGSRLVSETEITVFNDKYSKTEIDNKISSVYKYKGSVANYANLPTIDQVIGDVWNTLDTGKNYAWDGTAWDDIGGVIPKATISNDGLMPKEYVSQVDTNKTDILSAKTTLGSVPLTTIAQTVTGAINEHEEQINTLDAIIEGLSISPKGVFATLTDLQETLPTGNGYIYIVTADNNWYFWNGSAWESGGTYQSVDANLIKLEDINNHFVSGDVEGALAEIGQNIVDNANKNPIFFTDYDNVDRTGLTSSAGALSLALTDAINTKRKLYIPSGTYIVDTPIIINLLAIDLVVEGEDNGDVTSKTRLLWRGGVGTMFTFTSGRNVKFKNIEISGYDRDNDTDVLTVGSVGFYAEASLNFENCGLNGFDNIVVWNGGYYHKFLNCIIKYSKIAFKNYNANNLIFSKCKFNNLECILTVNGGNGPVVVDACSIEAIYDIAFSGVSGVLASIVVNNSYFENYPSNTPVSGLALGSGYSFASWGSITVIGNIISTKGISRFIYGATGLKQVISIGNTILYAPVNATFRWYIYLTDSLETCIANDLAYPTLTESGTYTPVYISNNTRLGTQAGVSRVYDPIAKKMVTTNSGTTANRPIAGLYVGYPYFDTTLNKPIWYNGTVWVDSTGTTV